MARSNALSYLRRKTFRYVRNVGKSVGYVAIEDLKPQSTAIQQLYKDARELSNNVKTSNALRRAQKDRNKNLTTSLSQSASRQNKTRSEFAKNLISDLKTGKWYNKERMDKSANDMFDWGEDPDNYTGVSFNFDDDDFGDGLYDNEGQSTAGSGRRKKSTVAKAFNQVGMAASSVTAEASIKSAQYIAESNNLAAQAIYDSMNYNFGQVMMGLNAINTNVQFIQATVNDSLNTHALNSAKFYIDSDKYHKESLELLKKISTAVDNINTNTSPSDAKGRKRTGADYSFNSIFRGENGLPDFKALKANIKKGFNEEVVPQLLMLLGLGGYADTGGSGPNIASNPIGLIAQQILQMTGLFPARLKRGVRNVNNTISNFFSDAIAKAQGFDFNKIFKRTGALGGLGGFLNEIKDSLLPKRSSERFDTSNYNKGKVDWDGIARKSLVEVIPTQLGKILSAITGENEMRYDYDHGKWIDTHKAFSDRKEEINRTKWMAGGNVSRFATAMINNNSQLSRDQKQNMNKMFQNFNEAVYDNLGTSAELDYLMLINPKRQIDDKLMDIAHKYGIKNSSELQSLRNLFTAMNHSSMGRDAVKSYHSNLIRGKERRSDDLRVAEYYNNSIDNMFYDGSLKFGNTSNINGVLTQKEREARIEHTKKSGLGSRANWKNGKAVGIQGLMNAVDDYGHDTFFYLQGIYMFTKHVSDNLPLLVKGGKLRKKDRISGVKLQRGIKGIEPIPDVRVESLIDNEEEPVRGSDIGNYPFTISESDYAKSKAMLDESIPSSLKDYVNTRQYLLSQGFTEYDLANSNEYRDLENKYQNYITNGRVKINNNNGKVRSAINKIPKIGKHITRGYDNFVDVLEAIGGSRQDLSRALGALIPGYNKLVNNATVNGVRTNVSRFINNERNQIANNLSSVNANSDFLEEDFINWIRGNNLSAAKGRKVTKTGVVAVSEGELIIPSELNPYYHGVTNKAKQIRDENRAVQQYFGNYSQGGVVGRNPLITLPNLVKYFMKVKGMDKVDAFFAAKEALENYDIKHNSGKRNGISRSGKKGKGITSKFNVNDMISGAKSGAEKVFNTVGDGLVNMFGPRDKKEAETEKKKVAELISGTFQDFGASKSSIITGGVLGGGISLLTGVALGPIAGAAIGAATGLITSSTKVQEALFGKDVVETDEKGKEVTKHEKGLLPDKIAKFLQNQLPDIAKGTTGGLLTGAVFGSPLIGAIVGGGIGFVKSSETAKNFLFGKLDKNKERTGGLISKDIQDYVKKALPNMAAGAALGLLAGPFGLAGNVLMGSALGFASSTDKFKNWMYGEEKDGKRSGGLMDKVKTELFDPITKGFRNLTNIATQQVTNLGKSLMKTTREFLFKHALKALYKTSIGQKLVGAGKKVLGGAWKLATTPGRILEDRTKRFALRKGYTLDGITSGERMNMRYDEFGNPYDINDNSRGFTMDKFLSSLNGNEEREQLLSAINGVDKAGLKTESDIRVERKKFAKMIREAYKRANLEPRDAKALNELYDDVIYGRFTGGEEELRNKINKATKNRLSGTEAGDKLLRELEREFGSLEDFNTRRDREINDAKQKAYELIDNNTTLDEKQKKLLKKKIEKGDVASIEYMKKQLGIDMKVAESKEEGQGESAVHMAPEIEEAIKETIPDKITQLINNVGHQMNLIYAKMTGQDVGKLDAELNINSKEAGTYKFEQKKKEEEKKAQLQAHADTIYDSFLSGDQYELTGALEDLDEYYSGSGSRRRFRGQFARGGRVHRGLAAVSKGELILPRNFFSGRGSEEDRMNPDIDSAGEDLTVRDQHGQIQENLGSSEVQKKKKNRASVLGAISAIPVGFATMNNTLTEIKDALKGGYGEGGEKKQGILDMISGLLFGGGLKNIISGAISVAAPVFAGLIGSKVLMALLQGKGDRLGSYLGFGQADHAGATLVDSEGQYVHEDPNTGSYVREDGTPAKGALKAVDTNVTDPLSDKLKYNIGRGIATGKGTVVGAAIKVASNRMPGAKVLAKGVKAAGGKIAGVISKKLGKNAATDLSNGLDVLEMAKNGAEAAEKSSMLLKLSQSLKSFGTRIKNIPLVGKFAQYVDDIADGLLDYIQKNSLKSGLAAAKSALKTAAFVLNAIFIVTDFVSGWQDAGKILGVKKPVGAQKFVCGFGRAILRAIPFIGTLLPEKAIIKVVCKIMGKLGVESFKNLDKQQNELQEEVDNYNEANGTNYTVEEYLAEVQGQVNIFDKAKNKVKSGFANIKNFFTKNKSGTTEEAAVSTGGSLASTGATNISGFNGSSQEISTEGNRVSNLVTKIKDSVDKGDIKSIMLNASKVGLGVSAGALMPALVGPAVVNALINKATGSTNVNKTGNSKLVKAVDAIGSLIKNVKAGNMEAIDAINIDTDSGMIKGIFNIIKVIAKIGAGTAGLFGGILKLFGGDGSTDGEKSDSFLTKSFKTISTVFGGTPLGNIANMVETSGSGSGFVSQFDPRYKNKRLGGKSIADNGCGPAAAVMAINQMKRMSASGTSMNSAINHASRYQTSGGTDAAYFADEFARNGYRANYSTNKKAIARNIAAGRPVVLMGNTSGSGTGGIKDYTPFGPNNHYVVANGFDRNGNIIISDPEQGGARSYSPSILNQVRLGISGGATENDEFKKLYEKNKGKYGLGTSNSISDGYYIKRSGKSYIAIPIDYTKGTNVYRWGTYNNTPWQPGAQNNKPIGYDTDNPMNTVYSLQNTFGASDNQSTYQFGKQSNTPWQPGTQDNKPIGYTNTNPTYKFNDYTKGANTYQFGKQSNTPIEWGKQNYTPQGELNGKIVGADFKFNDYTKGTNTYQPGKQSNTPWQPGTQNYKPKGYDTDNPMNTVYSFKNWASQFFSNDPTVVGNYAEKYNIDDPSSFNQDWDSSVSKDKNGTTPINRTLSWFKNTFSPSKSSSTYQFGKQSNKPMEWGKQDNKPIGYYTDRFNKPKQTKTNTVNNTISNTNSNSSYDVSKIYKKGTTDLSNYDVSNIYKIGSSQSNINNTKNIYSYGSERNTTSDFSTESAIQEKIKAKNQSNGPSEYYENFKNTSIPGSVLDEMKANGYPASKEAVANYMATAGIASGEAANAYSSISSLDSSSNSTAGTAGEEDPYAKYKGMGILEAITSIFGDALGKLFGKATMSNKNTTGKNKDQLAASLSQLTGKDPVDYMLSKLGKVNYSYGATNVDGGSADCSGMVQWAFKQSLGINIGRTSREQAVNTKYFKVVADAGGKDRFFGPDQIPKDLQRNDVLFFIRYNSHNNGDIGHVGIYIENGQYIDHGSGMGPRIKSLNGSAQQGLTKVIRLKDEFIQQLADEAATGVGRINPAVYGTVGGYYPDTSVTREIYKYFTNNGYSPAATAGIMGNMYRESHFDPGVIQKGSGHAAGLVQWESFKNKSGRWKGLYDYATSMNKSWQDLGSQLNYVNQEMHGNQYIGKNASTYKSASDYYNATDPTVAAYDFEKAFERGSVEAMEERMGAAQAYYDAYSGNNSAISNDNSYASSIDSNNGGGKYTNKMAASGSGLYKAMGDYIDRRGIQPKSTPNVKFVGGSSGNYQIRHNDKMINLPNAKTRTVNEPYNRKSKDDPMVQITDSLLMIVEKLVIAHNEDFHNITEIYNLLNNQNNEVNELNTSAKGTGTKKRYNSEIPQRTRSYEEISRDFADLKNTVRQIIS